MMGAKKPLLSVQHMSTFIQLDYVLIMTVGGPRSAEVSAR